MVGINPGPVATAALEMLLRHRAQRRSATGTAGASCCEDMPFGRPGKPEEIAGAVAFLASPRSGYTSARS